MYLAPVNLLIVLAKFITFSFAIGLVYGKLSKCKKSCLNPLFAMQKPATGLSIPPLNNNKPSLVSPNGNPEYAYTIS